jgi:thiosulfate/3-mercaptopyruvate sulfurtransferase
MRHSLVLSLLLLVATTIPALAQDRAHPGILVSADWLAAHLEAPDVVVLHVAREAEHFAEARIPGARHLAVAAIAPERDGVPFQLAAVPDLIEAFEAAGVSDGDHVVLYGDMDGLAATRAFFTLDVLGHDRSSVLDGGLAAWQAGGHQTEAGPAEPPARGSLTARQQAKRVVDAEWVRARLNDPARVLVDARPAAQYTGEEPGDGIERPGHIPGAANVFWQTTVAEDGPPVMLPADELRQRYEAAGLNGERTFVAYCRTGMQASHAYFVARLLGYDARLYDGSFFEWSNRTDYPVTSDGG